MEEKKFFITYFLSRDAGIGYVMNASDDRLSLQTDKELAIDKVIGLYFGVPDSNGFNVKALLLDDRSYNIPNSNRLIVNNPFFDERVYLEYKVDSKEDVVVDSPFSKKYGLTAVFDTLDHKKILMYDYLKKKTLGIEGTGLKKFLDKVRLIISE